MRHPTFDTLDYNGKNQSWCLVFFMHLPKVHVRSNWDYMRSWGRGPHEGISGFIRRRESNDIYHLTPGDRHYALM